MFQRKTQQVTVTVTPEEPREDAGSGVGLKSVLIPAALTAATAAKAKLSDQKEHGMAVAAPALAAAGAALGPKLGEARERVEEDVLPRVADAREHALEAKDQFVAETLPKLMEAVSGALAAGAVAKTGAVHKVMESETVHKVLDSEAAHRASDAALVLKGDAVIKRRADHGGFWRGLLATLGLLSLAGGLAWFFNKRSAEQDDPWARPLADPYIPPTSGRDSTVAGVGAVEGTAGSTGLVADSATGTGSAQIGRFGDVADGTGSASTGTQADAAAETGGVRVIDPSEFDHKPAQDAPEGGDSRPEASDSAATQVIDTTTLGSTGLGTGLGATGVGAGTLGTADVGPGALGTAGLDSTQTGATEGDTGHSDGADDSDEKKAF